ncbi:MAG TPA: MBL fold metallo-hydrolase [Symbiobacteriaceae bacterium]|nr:MBL fold metallo-hydrolase [Symbiobacteriaceae bacterium]
MKMERISEHIWSLKSWLLFPVHVWLVVADDGVTLVDAGFPIMAGGILRFIDQLNAGPLQRILLTHGHGDHVGSVTRIREQHPVPVYAHRIELPYLEGELPYPRRRKAETGLPKGLAQPLVVEPATQSAMPLTEEPAAQPFSGGQGARLALVAGLRPYLTPGHSPGHVAYYHEQDQVLLAGDLFTSKRGQLRRPMAMFTADMAEAVRSSAILRELQPKRLEVCHGTPVLQPAAQLDAYLKER